MVKTRRVSRKVCSVVKDAAEPVRRTEEERALGSGV